MSNIRLNFNKEKQFNNRIRQNIDRINKTALVTGLVALAAFGYKAVSFLRNLVTSGDTPFQNLSRGQMRRMWWLFAMYRPC